MVETSQFQLLLGDVEFCLSRLHILRARDVARLQFQFPLIDAALLIERGLFGFNLGRTCSARLIRRDGSLLNGGFDLRDDLPFLDEVAAVDQDFGEDARDSAAKLYREGRIHDTVKRGGTGLRRDQTDHGSESGRQATNARCHALMDPLSALSEGRRVINGLQSLASTVPRK